MQDLDPGVIAAIITSLSGLVVGLTALRKANSDARKNNADAAGVIVDGAGDVVKLLREQLQEQARAQQAAEVRQQQTDQRLMNLEVVVGSWEGWAERVLTILDRAIAMLEEDQRKKIQSDVDEVKQTRPKKMEPRVRAHAPPHEAK